MSSLGRYPSSNTMLTGIGGSPLDSLRQQDSNPDRLDMWQIAVNLAPSCTDYFNEVRANSAYEQIAGAIGEDLFDEKRFLAIHPEAIAITPQYKRDFLARIHDNVWRDGATNRSLLFLLTFMLGKKTSLTMRVPRAFASPQKEQEELDRLMKDQANLDMLDELAEIDRTCFLRQRLKDLVFQGHAVGRSVCVKKYNSEYIPEFLIPLSSLSLGNWYVDKRNYQPLAVEYKEFDPKNSIILVKDIIHYEVNNYHFTPNKFWMGRSSIEHLVTVTEGNRITNEIAVPEISKRSFAPIQIIQTNMKSDAKISQLQEGLDPLKTIVINGEMLEVKTIDLQVKIMDLIEKTKETDKKIYRDLTIPLVVAFQDEQNRSTAQYALNQWTVSVLEDKRTDLQEVLDRDWYRPNIQAILRKQNYDKFLNQARQDLVRTPLNTTALDQQRRYILTAPVQIPFDVVVVYENHNFDTFIEKTASVTTLKREGFINVPIGLEMLGLQKYIAQMKQFATEQSDGNMDIFNQEQDNIRQQDQQQQQDNENNNQPDRAGNRAPSTAAGSTRVGSATTQIKKPSTDLAKKMEAMITRKLALYDLLESKIRAL